MSFIVNLAKTSLSLALIVASSAASAAECVPSPWGADDEIGAANRVSPERTVAAATLVKKGISHPLGIVIEPGMPAYPPRYTQLQVVQPNQQFSADLGVNLTDAGTGLSATTNATTYITTEAVEGVSAVSVSVDLANQTASSSSTGNDILINVENIQTGFGDDLVLGDDADNTLTSGAGNDVINGAGGNDLIDGGLGDDDLAGGDGADALYGGSGDDRLSGDAGDDSLFGDDGDDILEGLEGDDLIVGGAGQDIAVFSGNQNEYTIAASVDGLTLTITEVETGDQDAVSGVEVLRFDDGDIGVSAVSGRAVLTGDAKNARSN